MTQVDIKLQLTAQILWVPEVMRAAILSGCLNEGAVILAHQQLGGGRREGFVVETLDMERGQITQLIASEALPGGWDGQRVEIVGDDGSRCGPNRPIFRMGVDIILSVEFTGLIFCIR